MILFLNRIIRLSLKSVSPIDLFHRFINGISLPSFYIHHRVAAFLDIDFLHAENNHNLDRIPQVYRIVLYRFLFPMKFAKLQKDKKVPLQKSATIFSVGVMYVFFVFVLFQERSRIGVYDPVMVTGTGLSRSIGHSFF